MYRGFTDPHTDYQDNWIEKYTMFVAEALHHEMSEEDIISELEQRGVHEQMLSLLLIAGKMIYQDEVNDYTGEE